MWKHTCFSCCVSRISYWSKAFMSSYLSKQSRETEMVKPGSPTTWTRRARPSAAKQRSNGLTLSSAPERRDNAGERTSSGPRDPRTPPWCWGGGTQFSFWLLKAFWGYNVSEVYVFQLALELCCPQADKRIIKKNLQIPLIGKYLSCTCWHTNKPSLSGSLSVKLWTLIALSTLSKLQRAAQTCVCTVCWRWPFSWFTVSTNCSKIFTLRKTNREYVIHRSGLACPSCIELWTPGVV